jgi:hypothetical protein
MRRAVFLLTPLLLLAIAWLLLAHKSLRFPSPKPHSPATINEPALMLWAWEVSEDLRTLNPQKAGVAFLAREVLLGDRIEVRPRRQPLRLAPGTYTTAVVRIETTSDFKPTSATAAEVAADIIDAQQETNADALQVDFDATASQRDFYTTILRNLHHHLPPTTPLSITALTSWCGTHSWLSDLPIDEAVPMFFRMGGPAATRATAPKSNDVSEPLCSNSVGVATDETWPSITPSQRVYVFRPGSWTQQDIAKINTLGYQSLKQ